MGQLVLLRGRRREVRAKTDNSVKVMSIEKYTTFETRKNGYEITSVSRGLRRTTDSVVTWTPQRTRPDL